MRKKSRLFEEVLVKNPVLVGTIGLCPVVAICTSFKAALIMSAITILTLVVAQVITSLLLQHITQWVRLGLYTIIGMLVVIPSMLVVQKLTPETMLAFGIYFPLLAVNPLIVRNCEREAVDTSLGNAILTSLCAGVGYSLVLIIVGGIREILGSGMKVMLMPAGGFIIIAYLAAALRKYFRKIDPKFADELIANSRTNIHSKQKSKLALTGATYEDGTAPQPKAKKQKAEKPKLEYMTLEEAEERKAAELPPVATTVTEEFAPVGDNTTDLLNAYLPKEEKPADESEDLEKTSRFEFITLDLSKEAKDRADAERFAEAVAESKKEKPQRQLSKRGQTRKVKEPKEGDEK